MGRPSRTLVEVSLDEIELIHIILFKAFLSVGPILGHFVQSILSKVYGEQWPRQAGDMLSKQMFSRLPLDGQRERKKEPLKDLYLVCELILDNLEVFQKAMTDSSNGWRMRGVHACVRLARLAAKVDFVSQTRTRLAHKFDVSAEDCSQCFDCIGAIFRGFQHLEGDRVSVMDELESGKSVRGKAAIHHTLACVLFFSYHIFVYVFH